MERLHYWLALEVSGGALGFGGFFLSAGAAFQLLFYAALLFTPYMLWMLHKAGWHGWIRGFALLVGLPLVLSYGGWAKAVLSGRAVMLLFAGGSPLGMIGRVLPLAVFYLYTWALKHAVRERIEALRWQEKWAAENAQATADAA